jgi:hypothetical protein
MPTDRDGGSGRASFIVTFSDGHQTTLDLSQLT